MDFERIKLVARREWWTRLRQRSFQVTTVVQILFVVIGACLPVIIAGFDDDDGPTASLVLVLDETGARVAERLAPYLASGGVETGGDIIALEQSALVPDEARAQVDAGDVDGALLVTRDGNGNLAFTFVNQSGDMTATTQRV